MENFFVQLSTLWRIYVCIDVLFYFKYLFLKIERVIDSVLCQQLSKFLTDRIELSFSNFCFNSITVTTEVSN